MRVSEGDGATLAYLRAALKDSLQSGGCGKITEAEIRWRHENLRKNAPLDSHILGRIRRQVAEIYIVLDKRSNALGEIKQAREAYRSAVRPEGEEALRVGAILDRLEREALALPQD